MPYLSQYLPFYLSAPPSVLTEGAKGISAKKATLHGTVSPNGLPTDYYFKLWKEGDEAHPIYTPTSKDAEAGEGSEAVGVSERVEGLEPHTVYLYRLIASNEDGEAEGATVSFETVLAPNRIRVTERPPMRQHILVTAPNGKTERWGEDELEAAKVIGDLTTSSSGPGGCKDFSCAVPRKTGIDYADMKPGSRVEVFGAGQSKLGEYRLERTPRTSGDYLVMDPSASGYQVLLSDDEGAREIFIDSDEGAWQDPSTQERLRLGEAGCRLDASFSAGWQGTGEQPPGLTFDFHGVTTEEGKVDRGEPWYYGGGVDIGALLYHFQNLFGGGTGTVWKTQAYLRSTDYFGTGEEDAGINHEGVSNANAFETLSAAWAGRKYAVIIDGRSESGGGGINLIDLHAWQRPRVLGRHGLTLRGTWPEVGFLASDVIPYLLSQFAPGLHYTTGTYGTIKPSNFVIPHLVFKEPTTVLDMLTTILSYELLEWGVWPGQFGPTFHLNQRGGREGRKRWRTRIRPAKFSETGQQMDQVWNRVVISWTDFDGTLKTMGPIGSGYPLTDSRCEDTDPQNLINQAGIVRTKHLTLDGKGTAEGAAEKSRLFLEKVKLLDGSGQATLTGYVEDEHGAEWPYYCVNACDEIEFVDSSIEGYRYIVEASPSRSSRSTAITIDAPPDSYEALLAELQVRETAAGF